VRLNVITLAIVILAVIFFVTYAMNLPWTALRIAGLAIALPAFILFSTARMQLGRSFSVEAKATELVTAGIYSRIRNPIYFFGALMILGVIVWTGRPILLLIYVILIPAQIVRARKEAQILEAKFGDAYVEYRKKTWF